MLVCLSALTCSYRDSRLIRALLYPPSVDMRSGPVTSSWRGRPFDHGLYAEVLRASVAQSGLVRYGMVQKHSKALQQYILALSRARPHELDPDERLALYLNAYNAFTLLLMLRHPQASSIRDIPEPGRWKGANRNLGGRLVSLDELEHVLIRRDFREPRIHFALVCASRGCPPLLDQPYSGALLDAQLTAQTRRFFQTPENLRLADGTLYVSELLDWFRGDFETSTGSLAAFVARYHEPAGHRLDPARVVVKFLPYDWRLNGDWTQ